MRRFAVSSAVLCLLAFAAVAPAAEETIDLGKITPADLVGPDPREALLRANEAYQDGRYEDAAREYVRVVRANPGDSNSLYNLACCFGLLGLEGQAASFLEAAYAAGFRDLGHVRNDPDFEKVRGSDAFAAAMERLEAEDAARSRASGERRVIAAECLAEYRVVEPDGEREPYERVPLVVALHGYGDNAENFAGLFVRRGVPQPFLFVAVETPYAFTAGPRGVGYSWSLNGVSIEADAVSVDLAERLVLAVVERVKREHRVDERQVFLMGFSQGAGMAFRIGLRHPERFAGVIPVGGWMDAGGHPVAEMERAAKKGRFLVCHSPSDRVVTFDAAERAVAELTRFGIPFRLVRYEGGHSLPKDLMETIGAWIAATGPADAPAAGADPAPRSRPGEKD